MKNHFILYISARTPYMGKILVLKNGLNALSQSYCRHLKTSKEKNLESN